MGSASRSRSPAADRTGCGSGLPGAGLGGLRAPAGVLDAGNSGTTIRMFSGVLAAHPFATTMTGDESLRSRPMKRIIVPLERMGARIDSTGGRPPLTVHGRADLQAIEYLPEVPSAQVKSAVLLAGLQTSGTTSVVEPLATRDHTERGLAAFGVRVDRDGLPRQHLRRSASDGAAPGSSRGYLGRCILDGGGRFGFGLPNRYRGCRPESHSGGHHRRRATDGGFGHRRARQRCGPVRERR